MSQVHLNGIIALAIGIASAISIVGCSSPDPSLPFCTRHAGRYESRQFTPGIFRGYCVFPDNTECEARAFYEGRCQSGQVRSADSSPQKLRMYKLIADLDQRGIKLGPASMAWGDPRPGKGWLGSTIPSGASGSVGLFETSFERPPSDLFLIRATESITVARDVEHRIPSYVEAFIRPYKPAIDALKYYRCDELIVVYLALPPRGFDPAVDKALTEMCGPAFAQYPTD